MQQTFSFIPAAEIQASFFDEKCLTTFAPSFSPYSTPQKRDNEMTYNYRGFEIERSGGLYVIRENGRIVDDASSDVVAEDKINILLLDRQTEDAADNARSYRFG